MSNFNFILQKLNSEFEKIRGYFDKKNDMYIFLWYGFVVGKYQKDLFDKTNKYLILKQIKAMIRRIKILYATPKEIRTVKHLKQ